MVISYDSWNKLIRSVNRQNSFREQFKISYSYISKKIGEPEEKIKKYLSLTEETLTSFFRSDPTKEEEQEEYLKYDGIREKISTLFDREQETMTPERKWNALIKSATELYRFKKRFNLSYSYLSEQTGISAKKISSFFALSPESKSNAEFPDQQNYLEYSIIRVKIEILFQNKKNSNGYTLLDDDEFYEIHELLMQEINISATDLAELIKEKAVKNKTEELLFQIKQINRTMEEYEKIMKNEKQESDAMDLKNVVKYIPMFRQEKMSIQYFYDCEKEKLESIKKNLPLTPENVHYKKAVQNIDRRTITQPNFTFTSDQQKAVLETYFEKCLDDHNFLLPVHLGTGIRLAFYLSDSVSHYSQYSANHKSEVYFGIKKIKDWISPSRQNEYDFGDIADKPETYDKAYEFISSHKRIFFSDPLLIMYTDMILQKINNSPEEVQEQLHDFLNDEFNLGFPTSKESREHYQTISEYLDIISNRETLEEISKYSKNQIYRILYDICRDLKIRFKYRLVDCVFILIHRDSKEWEWQMYVSNYYFKHKDIGDLFEYIQSKSLEHSEKEQEL